MTSLYVSTYIILIAPTQSLTWLSKKSPENQPTGPYIYATTDMAVHDCEKFKHERVFFERINNFSRVEYIQTSLLYLKLDGMG